MDNQTDPQIDIANLPEKSIYTPKNIPIEKFIELRKKGLSHSQIGKVLGCSHAASIQRLKAVQDELDCATAYGKNKSEYFNHKQWKLLNSITDDVINEMGGYQRIIGASILYDKQRLEDGRSTANVSVKDMAAHIDDSTDKINNILSLIDNQIDTPLIDNKLIDNDNEQTHTQSGSIDIKES